MNRAKPDALLPMWVNSLPAHVAFQSNGLLRPAFQSALDQGVIRVIAGPDACHVCIDVQRPYYRPRSKDHVVLQVTECQPNTRMRNCGSRCRTSHNAPRNSPHLPAGLPPPRATSSRRVAGQPLTKGQMMTKTTDPTKEAADLASAYKAALEM